MAAGDVAPDGSPVPVYRAMPPHDAVDLVLDQVPRGGTVLDLGCGTGRLANALAAAGLVVTGVDVHAGMLAHLSDAVHAVHADIVSLDLDSTFDVVVLASHLVNHPTDASAFLATCRRHVARSGAVLIERFAASLLDDPDGHEGEVDGVHVRHDVRARDGTRFRATAHYTVGGRTWTQDYDAVLLDDAAMTGLLRGADLEPDRWLDEDARWLAARPDPGGSAHRGSRRA